MVVLTCLLNMDGTTWNVDAIADAFHRFFLEHPEKRFDYHELESSSDPEDFPLRRVRAKLLQMPLYYLSNTENDWFILDKPGGTFSIKPELEPWWNDPFSAAWWPTVFVLPWCATFHERHRSRRSYTPETFSGAAFRWAVISPLGFAANGL